MSTWQVKIYRRDSETPVEYDKVKHAWWEDGGARFVVAQYTNPPDHQYFIWPVALISHVAMKKEA